MAPPVRTSIHGNNNNNNNDDDDDNSNDPMISNKCPSIGNIVDKAINIRRRMDSHSFNNNNNNGSNTMNDSFNFTDHYNYNHHHHHQQQQHPRPILNSGEFKDLEELGCGFGGVVFRSLHLPTGTIMARKLVNSRIGSAKIRKSLAAELLTLQRCKHPNIVRCYGANFNNMQISMALEYMDVGSFDWICKTMGPIPETILASTVKCVLDGLIYLHQELNIIHRDLKPSNILLNSRGEIKLCDFGESIELVNSLAMSLVGTTGYMAPERIQAQPYTIRSEVWSLGISLIELATGHFPYNLPTILRNSISPISFGESPSTGDETRLAIVELWETISNDPAPKLDPNSFSPVFVDFVNLCLIKDEKNRPDPYQLLSHSFLNSRVDQREWAFQLHQRKHACK